MPRRLTKREKEFILHFRDRLGLAQVARRLRIPKSLIQAFLLEHEGHPVSTPTATSAPGPPAEPPRARALGLIAWCLGGLALLLVLALSPLANNDIWLHLKTGELILAEGSIPQVERYSFTAPGRPLVPHEWGAAILFALVHGAAGVAGLIGLKALLAAAAFAVVALAARGMGARAAVLTLPLALTMVLVSSRLSVRPHLWSYLLAALFLLILDRHRRRGGPWILLLLPLQILWANLHGGFPLGWLVAGCYIAAEGAAALRRVGSGAPIVRPQARWLALVTVALPLVCIANPAGFHLLLFPFRLTGTDLFMTAVYEWLPPFSPAYRGTYMFVEYLALTGLALLVFLVRLGGRARIALAAGALIVATGIFLGSTPVLVGGLAIGAVGFVLGRGAVPPAHGFVFLALFLLSTRMNRAVTDYALLILAPVSAALDRSIRRGAPRFDRRLRRRTAAATAIGGLVLALVAASIARAGYWTRPGFRREVGIGITDMPVGAVDFLERAGVEGRALVSYNAASYVIWRLHPSVRVFVDSRNEAYPEEILSQYVAALEDRRAFSGLLDRHAVDAVLLTLLPHPPLAMAEVLDARPDFALVYFDDRSAVYVRESNARREMISRHAFELLSPLSIGRRRIDAASAPDLIDEGRRALEACRQCLIARGALAEGAFVLGQLDRSASIYRALAAESPDLYLARARLGDIHGLKGEVGPATRWYREALRTAPDDAYAKRQIESLQRLGRVESVQLLPGSGPAEPPSQGSSMKAQPEPLD